MWISQPSSTDCVGGQREVGVSWRHSGCGCQPHPALSLQPRRTCLIPVPPATGELFAVRGSSSKVLDKCLRGIFSDLLQIVP